MGIKVLMVDDDAVICRQIKELFDGEMVNGHELSVDYVHEISQGIDKLKANPYNLVILDLYQGVPSDNNPNKPGEEILDFIKGSCFIPVIFFSGLVNSIRHLESGIVRVVRKVDGHSGLRAEVDDVFASNLPLIASRISENMNETMRSYFWDFVHPHWDSLKSIKDDVSLGYLLMRRLANSLSKDKIKNILGDNRINSDKAHPMEFYIYPANTGGYESGDILNKGGVFYVILTPTCDMVVRGNKPAKAKNVALVKALPLAQTSQWIAYSAARDDAKKKGELVGLIKNNKSDQFFFLPKTFFIENSVLDFQDVSTAPFSSLGGYEKVAKIDDPFSQSMLGTFIRYYNRVGFEDIDVDVVLQSLN